MAATTLDTARDAHSRHAWAQAEEAFLSSDDSALTADDFIKWSEASWFIGNPDSAMEAMERAFARFQEEGNVTEAAITAIRMGYLLFRRGAEAVGGAWIGRAAGLLQDQPVSEGHAWLDFMDAARAFFVENDVAKCLEHLDRAIALADQVGSLEVETIAKSVKGYVLIYSGSWAEGMALIDESASQAMTGGLSLHSACSVFCNTIAACRDTGDFKRAGEWTEQADRWMQRHGVGGYPGVCRVHRAELKRLAGDYAAAEREATRACKELEQFRLLDSVGFAHSEVGHVRYRRGDVEMAATAFAEAYEYGSGAQPGLALVQLAGGDADGAAASIAASLQRRDQDPNRPKGDVVGRARLLPAQLKIAHVRGDVATAQAVAAELTAIGEEIDRPAFHAAAATARGTVALMEGNPEGAIDELDRAWRAWREVGFPYESADARRLLGLARREAGDAAAAELELRAALSTFERIGAARDADTTGRLLGGEAPLRVSGERVTRTFWFSDIVDSTRLASLIGDEAWERLLHWHDRALREEFARHSGQEVRHTGDGFFVTFDNAVDAAECSVAIQRRLEKHREETGFAPGVRIGFHTAEATREGSDYSGVGVHVAARIGGAATGGEIVTSGPTLANAGALRFPLGDRRRAEFKGISETVELVAIQWR